MKGSSIAALDRIGASAQHASDDYSSNAPPRGAAFVESGTLSCADPFMTPTASSVRLALIAATVALAACASKEPAPKVPPLAPDEVVAPNEHLRAEGIPPIPKTLAERVGKYTEFRPVSVVAWHPTANLLLVAYRRDATTQLHLLDRPMGKLEPLTDFPDPVSRARFEPKHGAYVVYERDTGGNEAAQLYRLDLATRTTTLLSEPGEKHELGQWNRAGTALWMTSTQLDKTAGDGARRDSVTTDLYALDPMKPKAKRRIASLPGGGWGDFQWGANDRQLYAQEYRSATDSTIWRIDAASGARTPILPRTKTAKRIAYGNLGITADGRTLLYTSDEDGEFTQLMALELASGKRRVLTRDMPWNVEAVVMPEKLPGSSARGVRALVAALVNVAGRSELHLYDVGTGREIALPTLPPAARSGSVTRVRLLATRERQALAFTVSSAQSPGDVYSVELGMGTTSAAEQWTRANVDGIDTAAFREAEIVEWKSFDGQKISGLLNRPPAARFPGRRPVLVAIHGGPEGQATIGFLGRTNYYVDELGIALVQPNVRGSDGFGKTYLSLDDGLKREDSVKDIGALLDWIESQPDLDPKRVMVIGGSYGGYMSLAVATTYPDRIAGSIDIVGISNFTSFLQRTETYRRDLRRVEYGDERDPAMHEFFERISPLSKAANIGKPLFVVQGLNDPRVPYQEAEQIVAKVRGNGIPVWYLVADNEGHGFVRKPNADFQFYAQTLFMQKYLLGDGR